RECEYCPFERRCSKLRGDVPLDDPDRVVDEQFVAEIADLVLQEKRWDAKASAAEDEKRKIQESIKQRLRERGLRRVAGKGITVVWSRVAGRVTLDKKAMRSDGIDVTQYEKTGEPYDVLNTRIKRGAGS